MKNNPTIALNVLYIKEICPADISKINSDCEKQKILSKPLGGSKVDSAFHPSEVNKMSTRNFWEISGKK